MVGPTDQQRRAERFLEDPALVEPAVLAEVEPLVGGVDDDGVGGQAFLVEILEDRADAFVHGLHRAEVVVQVAVVFPADEVFSGQRHVGELLVPGHVVGVPDLALFGRETGHGRQLVVVGRHDLLDRHVLVFDGESAAFVVVEKRRRLGIDAVLVVAEMAEGGGPFTMRRLVLDHGEEGFGLVPLLQPFQRTLGDDVRHVARLLDVLAHADHGRVVVDALAGKDLPMVETRRVAHQVPLAEDGRLVAGFLQELWKGGLRPVEAAVRVVGKAVQMGILSGQHRGPAGAADGVRHEAAVEAHAFLGDAVEVGRVEQLPRITVGADGLVGVVVREDEDDVGRLGCGGIGRGDTGEDGQ